MPRWQAAPKDWIPGDVATYSMEAVVGGRGAKTTKAETVYHRGYVVKVSIAMKATIEAEHWAAELRVYCQPNDAMLNDTWLYRLLMALRGMQAQVNAATLLAVGRPPARVRRTPPRHMVLPSIR